MTKQYKLYSLSILFLLLLVAVANAANGPQITGYQSGSLTVDKTYNYRTTLLDQNFLPATNKTSHIIDINYTVHLDYVFKWKLSILMGEPVVIGWVSYKPTRIHSLDPDIDSNVFSDEELLKKVGLTEFTMEVRLFLDPNNVHDQGAIFVVDAGSAGNPYIGYSSRDLTDNGSLFSQFCSFNTPGSPDWDKLFTNISSVPRAKKYFTDITISTIKRNHSYYRYDVEKVGIDSGNVDQAIYKYLQGLEKKIRDKEKTERKKLQEQNKKQTDEFDDALGKTESVSSADKDNDFLSEIEFSTDEFDKIMDGIEPGLKDGSTDSLENIFSNKELQDKKRREKECLAQRLAPINQKYQKQLQECNAGKPAQQAFNCGRPFHLLTMSYDDPDKQRRYLKGCAKEERRWDRVCHRRKLEWKNKASTFPQRLAEWTLLNKECIQKATAQHDTEVKETKQEIRSVTELFITE